MIVTFLRVNVKTSMNHMIVSKLVVHMVKSWHVRQGVHPLWERCMTWSLHTRHWICIKIADLSRWDNCNYGRVQQWSSGQDFHDEQTWVHHCFIIARPRLTSRVAAIILVFEHRRAIRGIKLCDSAPFPCHQSPCRHPALLPPYLPGHIFWFCPMEG